MTLSASPFEILVAATGKTWLLIVDSLKDGAIRWLVVAERKYALPWYISRMGE